MTPTRMLIDCSRCRTPLELPHGATSIRCAICQAITNVAPPPTFNFYAPPTPFNSHGRKKAVIIGISYRHSSLELNGCINDAKCMKYMLVNRFRFPEASVLMLTEEETDPYRIPTKQNIRMALRWLIHGCQSGDSLLFHYSGHGSQLKDEDGDEVDGYDETICPVDFETKGMIVDDEINQAIVRPLPSGVRLHAIVDACHSGTVLDLPFLCRMDRSGRYVWEDHRPRTGAWKGTSGGEAISFSGCDDSQTSADTDVLSKITTTGAMTFCFIQAIEHGQATTYGSVLNYMRAAIRNNIGDESSGSGRPLTTLMNMLSAGGSGGSGSLIQEPQLTSENMFDVYNKPFYL